MAKLKAHGKELFRLSKECTFDVKQNGLISYSKTTFAVMEDRTFLKKRCVRFWPDTFNPAGRYHDYGWKRGGKLYPTDSLDSFKQELINQGFKLN